jgi:NAD(P)-dependent dehydrogenase (short-subunit alcohol dehydrogenase family)
VHHFIKATAAKGTIVNLVTVGASFLAPGLSSYSASKLAVIKLGEFLDLGTYARLRPGIRPVRCIAPVPAKLHVVCPMFQPIPTAPSFPVHVHFHFHTSRHFTTRL